GERRFLVGLFRRAILIEPIRGEFGAEAEVSRDGDRIHNAAFDAVDRDGGDFLARSAEMAEYRAAQCLGRSRVQLVGGSEAEEKDALRLDSGRRHHVEQLVRLARETARGYRLADGAAGTLVEISSGGRELLALPNTRDDGSLAGQRGLRECDLHAELHSSRFVPPSRMPVPGTERGPKLVNSRSARSE